MDKSATCCNIYVFWFRLEFVARRASQDTRLHHLKNCKLRHLPRELLSRASGGDFVSVAFPDQPLNEQWAPCVSTRVLAALGLREVITMAPTRDRYVRDGDMDAALSMVRYTRDHGVARRRLVIRLTLLDLAVVEFFMPKFETGRRLYWSDFFKAVASENIVIHRQAA